MAENEIARFTKESMHPGKWASTALVLTFVASYPGVAMFNYFVSSDNMWAAGAAYNALLLWWLLQFLFFAWSKARAYGGTTSDMAARLVLRGGWHLRDVAFQLLTGFSSIAIPVLFLWVFQRPGLHAPDFWIAVAAIAFIWFVATPIETMLQAWLWPMSLPFGPVTAQIVFLLLHGARALDPAFAFVALTLGFWFWILTYLRYTTHRFNFLFGPIAGWSAHATWNSLLLWVALSWPAV